MTKEINVTGRVPLSVRRQVKQSKNRKQRRETLKRRKNKGIKKIKTPTNKSTSLDSKNSHLTGDKTTTREHKLGGILHKQTGLGRTKNKTVKKVRFNLESQGVQTSKFRNAHRVKMKTAKRGNSMKHRSKNRTSKNRRFKIRFSEEDQAKTKHTVTNKNGSLISRLKEFKTEEASDVSIVRV